MTESEIKQIIKAIDKSLATLALVISLNGAAITIALWAALI